MFRSIGTRLALGYVVIVLLLILVAGVGLSAIAQVHERSNDVVIHNVPLITDVGDRVKLLDDEETGLRGYLLTGDRTYLQPYYQARKQLPAIRARDIRLVRNRPDLIGPLARMTQRARAWERWARPVLTNPPADPRAPAALAQQRTGKYLFDLYRASADETIRALRADNRSAVDRISSTVIGTQALIAAILFITLLAAVLIGWISRRMVVRPLSRLEQAATVIGQGDLSHPVAADGAKEFQTLAFSMDHMRADLAAQFEERRRQLSFIQAVTNSVGEGLYTLDRAGNVTSMNPAACWMLGWSQDELLGKNMHDAIHSRRADGSHRPWQECPLREVLQSGASVKSEDDVFMRKDGTLFPVSYISNPIYDGGKVVGSVLSFDDITSRKRAQEELRQQHEETERAQSHSRAVLDAASDAMVLVSPAGRFLTFNSRFAQMFNQDIEEPLGQRFDRFAAEVERVFVEPDVFIQRVLGTSRNETEVFTEIVLQKWPEQRELHLFSTPVHVQSGNYMGRLYVFRDVTHEREVDRMKTEFISLVSHELRTPLTSIKGYVDLLIAGEVGDISPDQADFLEIVKNNADRLVALINDLLDVSRIESGKIQLDMRPIEVADLIRGVSDSMRPQLAAKGQHLVVDVPDEIAPMIGDHDRLIQIVTNLISNAYKYTPNGGTITVTATPEPAHVCISVSDTGIGLTPEDMSQLFTRFFRARNRATQEAGGTGLGLTITRSLVEMHGGEMNVESVPGEGSTFSFTIPTVERREEPRKIEEQDGQVEGTVLVVDDEPDIAGLIRRYLERAGYTVHEAHSGTEALQLAEQIRPNLITLDINLPDADGLTVLEWLKGNTATSSIPVVLLSIMDDTGHGKMLGAVDYVTKPVQEATLLSRVRLALASTRNRTILVADDDRDILNLVTHLLQKQGYDVITAINGREAVELARQEHPALVLMDINMPEMTGVQALEELRADATISMIPVIMMTATPNAAADNQSAIERLGASTLLTKPYTAQELADAIAEGLREIR
jgi:PAS domain S-box-containing protein